MAQLPIHFLNTQMGHQGVYIMTLMFRKQNNHNSEQHPENVYSNGSLKVNAAGSKLSVSFFFFASLCHVTLAPHWFHTA